jgi:hypothetical protein
MNTGEENFVVVLGGETRPKKPKTNKRFKKFFF